REPHNTTDTIDRKRLIKAIRIALQESWQTEHHRPFPKLEAKIFGIDVERSVLRERITRRLHDRLASGMTDEVTRLLESGIPPETLKFYGLEYKFITLYLQKQLSYEEMVSQLNRAIHRFAKRQLTWFRRMERQGTQIHWIDHTLPIDKQLAEISSRFRD
ncbi:MAG: tRNA (adenosine(37)-N6)-dimethylallyltransferase MiaA, partial [bacterium]